MGVVCSTLNAKNLHDETKLTPYDSWFTFPSSLPKFYPLQTFHFCVPLGCLTSKLLSSSNHDPHPPNTSVPKGSRSSSCAYLSQRVARAIGWRLRHPLELYYWLGAPCSPHPNTTPSFAIRSNHTKVHSFPFIPL